MGRQHGLPARAASLLSLIIIIIKVGIYQQLYSRASEKLTSPDESSLQPFVLWARSHVTVA
jgi:hypothetical protein